jgi:hypothetical protein
VFVNRAPVKPGKVLDAADTTDVYVTDQRSIRFDSLPDTNAGKHNQERETQRVTIVYLDGDNRRMGESAFQREFFLERP